LTTVAQPAFELGKAAAEMLICRIEQVNPCLIHHVLPTRLVIRQSSGKSIQPNKEVI